jgi:hypothetical protein
LTLTLPGGRGVPGAVLDALERALHAYYGQENHPAYRVWGRCWEVQIEADEAEPKSPTPEALAVGRFLAEFPPSPLYDRFSERGWAVIADAVWSAEDALKEPEVDLDGRPVRR